MLDNAVGREIKIQEKVYKILADELGGSNSAARLLKTSERITSYVMGAIRHSSKKVKKHKMWV